MGEDHCSDGHGGCHDNGGAIGGDAGGVVNPGTGISIGRDLKQLQINGAPVTEQSHEFVIKASKKNAPRT